MEEQQLLLEARRLAEGVGELLFEAEFENVTPALVGSWRAGNLNDPVRVLLEPPRPTDIAGKARWWLRSILAGGAYEIFGGHLTLGQLNSLASEIMGDTSRASKIQIVVEPPMADEKEWRKTRDFVSHYLRVCKVMLNNETPNKLYAEARDTVKPRFSCTVSDSYSSKHLKDCCLAAFRSPRVLLSTLGRKPEEAITQIPLPPGAYRFRIRVYRRPHTNLTPVEEKLAGYALGLALFLFGIGRGVTRGYGKLKLRRQEPHYHTLFGKALLDIYYSLKGGYIDKVLASIVSLAAAMLIARCRRLGGQTCRNKCPLTYTLHQEHFSIRHTKYQSNLSSWYIVSVINEVVQKDQLEGFLGCEMPARLLASLGIPRRSVPVSSPQARLQSAIQFAPFINDDVHRIYVAGFNVLLPKLRKSSEYCNYIKLLTDLFINFIKCKINNYC
jgi:CRISPR type III-B/RAMP module RAMP protein Cmr1